MKPIIQNIVCTCNIGCTLYLPQVCRSLRVTEYDPERFAAVTFRLHTPMATALIFSSGRIVCTGTKCRMDARLAMLTVVYLLNSRLQLPVNVYQFQIQNMVASASIEHGLSLNSLYVHHSRQSSYDPELFPGLIYRDHTLPAVVLLFESGKMVITGAKHENDIYCVFESIVPIATQYLCENVEPSKSKFKEVIKHVRKQDVPVLSLNDFAPILDEHI